MWGTSQIREEPPTHYESALCEELVGILRRGIHDLARIVAELKKTEVKPETGGEWTEDVFIAELARLGDGPEHGAVPGIRY